MFLNFHYLILGSCSEKIIPILILTLREGAKIIGIYAGQDDGGASTFFAKKNEGAKTFCEEENDGTNAFFDEKNDGAETFFGRNHIHSFFVIDAFLSNARCRMCHMLRY